MSSEREPQGGAVEARPQRRPGRVRVVLIVAACAVALDAASKILVVALLGEDESVRLLGGALYLVQARNAGAAFSIGSDASMTAVFTVIAAIVAAVIVRTARQLRSGWWALALGLILGGALGNLVDRLFRAPGFARGHVVDWISVFADDGGRFPIFNLADSAITCGAILAVLLAVLGVDFDGSRHRDAASDGAASDGAAEEGSRG